MIRIRIIWKLPGRHTGSEDLLAPEGSRVGGLLDLLHAENLRDHVLLVRNKHMTDGTEVLCDGDSIIILPVICGG